MCLSRPPASCTETKPWDRPVFQICSILTAIMRRSIWSLRIHMQENSLKKKTGQSSGSSSLKNVVLLFFLSLPLALTNPSLLVGLDVSLNASSECSSRDSIWKVLGFGKAHTLHQLELFPSKIQYHLATEVTWEMEDGVQGLFFALREREAMFFAMCDFSSSSHWKKVAVWICTVVHQSIQLRGML